MTAAHESHPEGFAIASAGGPGGGHDLADPRFRFPVKSRAGQPAESTQGAALPISTPIETAVGPLGATAHQAEPLLAGPHFQVSAVERFVGWTVAEIAAAPPIGWPSPSATGREWSGQQGPKAEFKSGWSESQAGAISETPGEDPGGMSSRARAEQSQQPPTVASDAVAADAVAADAVAVRPVELPRPGRTEAVAADWPTNSRERVAGFSIQRTRFDQPHAIVTGAGLAAGHRRWAARNLSAELQSRAISDPLASNPPDASLSSALPATTPAPATSLDQATQFGAGLPLMVHPDFRWNSVVEQLCRNQGLAHQLLAVADQLLESGGGRVLIAGSRRCQGTTTLAATISRLLIERGQRVLMVDADLASAGWTTELELTSAGSWADQVLAFEPLQAAMAFSRRSNSAVVALRPIQSRKLLPPFLLDYLGQLLHPLQRQFEATVIDVGPVSQMLEELTQPTRLGASLLIVQHGGPDAALELRRVKTTLNAFGISRLAVVQNFATREVA